MAGLSENFLFRLLVLLAKDYDFCDRYFDLLPTDFFDLFPVQSRVYGAIKFYRDTYSKNPRWGSTLPALLATDPPPGWSIPKDDEADVVLAFIEEVFEADTDDRAWVEDRLKNELQRMALKLALREGAELAQEEDFSPDTLEFLKGKLEAAEELSVETEDLGESIKVTLNERIERRLRAEDAMVRIPTMIGNLDDFLTGKGLPTKSLNLVAARSGLGKSAALVHLCKIAALAKRFNALYITLELSKDYVEDRFDASLTETSMGSLVGNEKYLQTKFNKKREWGEIRVIESVPGKLSVSHIERILDRLKREKNFEPKLVCVDYADLMKFNRARKERWLELGDLFIGLRSIAVERDIVLWTASQINREGVDFASGETLAGSDEKLATCDFAISINRPPGSVKEDAKVKMVGPAKPRKVNVYIQKSRFGPMFENIEIEQDLDTMTFCIGIPEATL